jgi:hypothetical protein
MELFLRYARELQRRDDAGRQASLTPASAL